MLDQCEPRWVSSEARVGAEEMSVARCGDVMRITGRSGMMPHCGNVTPVIEPWFTRTAASLGVLRQ